jgi:hypothetical protein
MQQILNVITPASTYDLVTLDEMKMKLGIDPSNTATDDLLSELITNVSETIAKFCNRVFAYEEVHETFYQLEDGFSRRLYLSRWPVALSDIETITQDGKDILADQGGTWVLEELTGTLYRLPIYGGWYGVIDVNYSGGYDVPDNTPGTLKFAVEAVLRESYMSWIRNPTLFGVRQVSHKESRVGYFAPNMFPVLGLPQTWQSVGTLLQKYIRQWV